MPLDSKSGALSHRLIGSTEKPKTQITPIKEQAQSKVQSATSEKSVTRNNSQYSHVKSKFSTQPSTTMPLEERLIQDQLDKRMKQKIQSIQNEQKAGRITFQEAIERINKIH